MKGARRGLRYCDTSKNSLILQCNRIPASHQTKGTKAPVKDVAHVTFDPGDPELGASWFKPRIVDHAGKVNHEDGPRWDHVNSVSRAVPVTHWLPAPTKPCNCDFWKLVAISVVMDNLTDNNLSRTRLSESRVHSC
ncbi:hypothetical protein IRJ41_007638 [Triplophysa rosa]|uniref:Uncharacterized protein n=1 Tax=Triplophysa rosa TaxID=992332 RepID=A0A9W8C8U2_TRIRA|nr:hypothetical protein IRJ41_007638 [Triplophysa rosa]